MTIKLKISFLLCVSLFASCNVGLSESKDSTKTKMLNAIAKLNPVTVYGKIVDQYGMPVAKAKVRVSWVEISIPPDTGQSKWIETDDVGEWTITVSKPDRISVRDVVKSGYEFNRKQSLYFSDPNKEERAMHTSKDEPMVLVVRKKGESTFLIHHKGDIAFSKAVTVKSLNLFDMNVHVDENFTNHLYDLEAKATFNEKEQVWTFVFIADLQNAGGVIVNDAELYEAPAEGYKNSVRVTIPLAKYGETLSLCIKSREPSVFSRIDLQFFPRNDRCILSYDVWANPYGSRNLEYDRNFEKEWKIRKQLERQASADIREGRRPEKVDIKTLIEENKDAQ